VAQGTFEEYDELIDEYRDKLILAYSIGNDTQADLET